jgi:hypothetical protein
MARLVEQEQTSNKTNNKTIDGILMARNLRPYNFLSRKILIQAVSPKLRHAAHQLCHCVANGTVFQSPDLAEIGGFPFVFRIIGHFRSAAS